MFDEDFWEGFYGSRTAVWSGNPNPQLVAETSHLTAGTALDVGCGEGADAVWLATRGWTVTGVDLSATALQRAAVHAEAAGVNIRWRRADLTVSAPDGMFDLVSAQFMQLPPEPRRALFARLAAAVAPGGTLLIVGHHPGDLETSVHRPPVPGMFYTAEEVAESLDPDEWGVLAADARPRTATDPDGQAVTIHDAVLRARRRL